MYGLQFRLKKLCCLYTRFINKNTKYFFLQNNTYKPKALVIVSGREKYIYDPNSKIEFFD